MKNAFGAKSFVFSIYLFMQFENVFAYTDGCKKEAWAFSNARSECEARIAKTVIQSNWTDEFTQKVKEEGFENCITPSRKLFDECIAEEKSKQTSLQQGSDSNRTGGSPSNSSNTNSASVAVDPTQAAANQRGDVIKKSMNTESGEIYQCIEATDKAKDDCRLDRSDEMKAFLNFGQMMGALTQASSKQDESYCNKMKNMGDLASSGLSGFKLYCAAGYKTCSSKCDAAKTFLNNKNFQYSDPNYTDAEAQVKKASKDCGKLTGSLAEAAGYIVVMVQNHANAKQCKALLGKADNELCKMNKEFCDPLASLDCNNPQTAMTNLVCKCKSNPNAEGCNGNVSGLSATNMTDPNGIADTAGLGAGAGKLPSAGGDVPEQYGFPFDGKPSEGKGANLSLGKGAQHGAGGIPAGGGNGAHPAAKPGPGGSNLNAGILNGWQGGRGNQGGWGNTGGGWGDGNKAAAANGKNPYMTVDKNGNPVDLRQFLPGQNMDATRGIAGISGPDGITGPNSSLWQKIRVRYSSQRNFMP